MNAQDALLSVRGLKAGIDDGKTEFEILHGVDFEVYREQRLGIVGESGSGKSMTMYSIAGLLPDTIRYFGGSIEFDDGTDIVALDTTQRRRFCANHTAIILQDSIEALNPYMKVYSQMEENVLFHRKVNRRTAEEIIARRLVEVGLSGDIADFNRYPRQFSGGMRQRIAIAMALETESELLIADEPTTSIDAVNQVKLLDLMDRICREEHKALIYISHNLGLVAHMCTYGLVMKDGRIVERGPCETLFSHPQEVYTQRLVRATGDLLKER